MANSSMAPLPACLRVEKYTSVSAKMLFPPRNSFSKSISNIQQTFMAIEHEAAAPHIETRAVAFPPTTDILFHRNIGR